MSFLTDIRTATTNIINVWATGVTIQRVTVAESSGMGGEQTEAWTTNLSTNAVWEDKPGGRVWGTEGPAYTYDGMLFLAHGSDVVEEDRVREPGTTAGASHYFYFRHVTADADKVVVQWARKRRESE